MGILKIVYLNEKKNAEYKYKVNVFNKELYLCFRIESLFAAVVPWYHLTVKNRSLF